MVREVGSGVIHELFGGDVEAVREFLVEVQEGRDAIERLSGRLERDPSNEELLRQVAEAVNAIKTGALMFQLTPAIDLAGAVERVMMELRAGRMHFTVALGEAVLLAVDTVREIAEAVVRGESLEPFQVEATLMAIERLCCAEANRVDELAQEAVERIVGQLLGDVEPPPPPTSPHAPELEETLRGDLAFFHTLSAWVEQRSPYWQGRGKRQAELARAMNEAAGLPVDPAQLEAAALLHDYGMAMLPESVLHKPGRLNPLELKMVRQHPRIAADYLARVPGWGEAAAIILQHQERFDGGGYPDGRAGDELHPGACILAIIDAFEAMTNERADRLYRRSLHRAVTQIHAARGHQFHPEWVAVFVAVMKGRYEDLLG